MMAGGPGILNRPRHSGTLHTAGPLWWCTAPDAAATHQCDHRVGGECDVLGCMAPLPWRLNTNNTTVGPCSATLVRAGHGHVMSTLYAPVWARAAPHSVRDNARTPPWCGAEPPCRRAGLDDAYSYLGGASTGRTSLWGSWRARVSLATPWWCHPRHGGAVTQPVGQPPPAPLCLQCLSQLSLAQSMMRCCYVGCVRCSRTHSLLSKGARMYTTLRVSYGYTTCCRCS